MEKYHRFQVVPHYKKGRFFNPYIRDTKRGLWNVLLWQLGYYNDPMRLLPPPDEFVYPQEELITHSNATLQWINHSTFFIKIGNIHLLTDPIWAKRASPLSFVGPKRKMLPGIDLDTIPSLDYVLISHNHYDHLDIRSIAKVLEKNPETKFFVPLGLKSWFLKRGVKHCVEADWGETVIVQHSPELNITFTAVPAQHFSGRSWNDKNKTLWCGWIAEFQSKEIGRKCLYFAGDTGYNAHDFREIGNASFDIDLSLIPIGSYVPKKFMSPVHIGPEEAVKIHQDVHSKLSVASHFGTFRLSEEPLRRPAYDLYQQLIKKEIPVNRFRVPLPGQIIHW